jgi:membrane protein DedA with SNARE-associated domain
VPFDHISLQPAVDAAFHLRRHVHGPAADYLGIGAAAAASWAGLPGPGEAALITAGIVAAHGRIDIVAVIAVAWLGAVLGGVIGWLVGLKAGRTVVSAPGPLLRARLSALARGDRFFERYGAVAVFFTPSWIAGIHGMRAGRFLAANAVAALVWSVVIGAGAFYAGPPIVELVDDLGLVSALVVGGLLAAAVVGAVARRRRRAA